MSRSVSRERAEQVQRLFDAVVEVIDESIGITDNALSMSPGR